MHTASQLGALCAEMHIAEASLVSDYLDYVSSRSGMFPQVGPAF